MNYLKEYRVSSSIWICKLHCYTPNSEGGGTYPPPLDISGNRPPLDYSSLNFSVQIVLPILSLFSPFCSTKATAQILSLNSPQKLFFLLFFPIKCRLCLSIYICPHVHARCLSGLMSFWYLPQEEDKDVIHVDYLLD